MPGPTPVFLEDVICPKETRPPRFPPGGGERRAVVERRACRRIRRAPRLRGVCAPGGGFKRGISGALSAARNGDRYAFILPAPGRAAQSIVLFSDSLKKNGRVERDEGRAIPFFGILRFGESGQGHGAPPTEGQKPWAKRTRLTVSGTRVQVPRCPTRRLWRAASGIPALRQMSGRRNRFSFFAAVSLSGLIVPFFRAY